MGRRNHARFGNTVRFPSGTDGSYDTLGTQRNSAAFSQLSSLIASALIPTRDGTVTVTSTATVDPITGAAVGANTANGRDLWIGNQRFPGAALRAERATTGVFGTASGSVNLSSNSATSGPISTQRTLIEDSTSAAPHQGDAGVVLLSDSTNYVFSTYVTRGIGSRNFYIRIGVGANIAAASVDLTTGVITTSFGGTAVHVRSSARLLSTGEWLFQMTFNNPAWGGSSFMRPGLASGTSIGYNGDGASSIIIRGYQCELGEYATMPLAWDGSAGVSRVAQLNSWNQSLSLTAGTVFAVGMPYGRSGTVGPASPRYYDAVNGLMFYNTALQGSRTSRTDALVATNNADTGGGTQIAVAGTQLILTQRFDATSNRTTYAGSTVSSAAPTLPFAAATPIILGNRAALDAHYDGWVGLLLFSTALSDADVALLTANSYIA